MFLAKSKTRKAWAIWAGTDNINKVWCVCGTVFDKYKAAINMRRQSSGVLHAAPPHSFFVLFCFVFFFFKSSSLLWCINMAWSRMLISTQTLLGCCSFPGCCIGRLFIYIFGPDAGAAVGCSGAFSLAYPHPFHHHP